MDSIVVADSFRTARGVVVVCMTRSLQRILFAPGGHVAIRLPCGEVIEAEIQEVEVLRRCFGPEEPRGLALLLLGLKPEDPVPEGSVVELR